MSDHKNSSNSDVVTVDLRPVLMPGAVVLSALIIGVSMIISAGILSGGGLKIGGSGTVVDSSTSSAGPVDPTTATTSIDNDAILGDKSSAQVAIVEFSDYDCPFCKQFHDQTLAQLKSEYIDTGKAILVYRDLPLSIHEPGASFAANIMECSRKQGGDSAYYKMHTFWFDEKSGQNDIKDNDSLIKYANSIGINGKTMVTCAQNEEFKDEIAADTSAASSIGITGTPGFVVGRLESDGTVTGEVISGAYPFATFQAAIDNALR